MKIAVLGAGMVGRAIALDLVNKYDVTSFDVNKDNLKALKKLNPAIKIRAVNLSEYKNFTRWLTPFGMAVSAVPGYMGYKTLKAIINAGKNGVDISFFS